MPDVVITEVGGTVGDMESLPFLEAIRQVRHEVGRDRVFYLHVSLVPYLAPSGELKTKPTQHSVAALRNIGIQPDALVCRSDREIPEKLKHKLALYCDVDREAVVACPDAPSIYDIPKVLHREGLDAYVVRRLGLSFRDVDWATWDDLLHRVHHPKRTITIALVGKYVDLPDAYLSVSEAIRAAGFANNVKIQLRWVPSDDCETTAGAAAALKGVDGIVIPGGFGVRGIEGKINTSRYARENLIPILGICLGLQCMTIDAARNLAGLAGANSLEFDERAPYPVISTMADQQDIVAGKGDLGGTMRLGAYPAALAEGSIVAEAVRRTGDLRAAPAPLRGQQRLPGEAVPGRAWSSPAPRRTAGWSSSSSWTAQTHPYFVATQAHPELKSRPTRPHPLFDGLVKAAVDYAAADELPVDPDDRGFASRARPPVTAFAHETRSRTQRYAGPIFTVFTDEVTMSGGGTAGRDVVENKGAVGVVALDDVGRVVLIRQYRHAVHRRLWELPAGLRDVDGEMLAAGGGARAGARRPTCSPAATTC